MCASRSLQSGAACISVCQQVTPEWSCLYQCVPAGHSRVELLVYQCVPAGHSEWSGLYQCVTAGHLEWNWSVSVCASRSDRVEMLVSVCASKTEWIRLYWCVPEGQTSEAACITVCQRESRWWSKALVTPGLWPSYNQCTIQNCENRTSITETARDLSQRS